MEAPGKRPLISVVLATFNESAWIESSLGSLMSQRIADCDLEVLVIDGLSTDDTREKVEVLAARDPRIRLLLNPAREIPFAWNIGLRVSEGEYLCTLGAHNIYDPTYLETCLHELCAHEAVACSGRVIVCARDETLQAALCAWVLAHPFGSSPSSFRTQSEGFVDSPAFPVFLKSAVAAVGGWDEQLFRAEDNDMSRRLAAAGGRFWCTGKTTCHYHGKSTLFRTLNVRLPKWRVDLYYSPTKPEHDAPPPLCSVSVRYWNCAGYSLCDIRDRVGMAHASPPSGVPSRLSLDVWHDCRCPSSAPTTKL